MLTKVEVYDARNNMLSLPIDGVGSSFRIRKVDGLDPVKASINTSKIAGMNGEAYQGSQGGARNIVLTLGFAPNWATESVASLRQKLYSFFMTQAVVRMRFYSTHMPTVEIMGYVESCEAPIFGADTDVQVSVICTKPEFYGIANVVVNGNSTAGIDTVNIPYAGTLETGFLFVLSANRALTGFSIYNTALVMQALTLTNTIGLGSFVEVNSVPGSKYAQIRSDIGDVASILYAISSTSDWPKLQPGANAFRAAISGAAVPWTITYVEKYGGI